MCGEQVARADFPPGQASRQYGPAAYRKECEYDTYTTRKCSCALDQAAASTQHMGRVSFVTRVGDDEAELHL